MALLVDLKTDFVPGVEFSSARVRLREANGGPLVSEASVDLELGRDTVDGVRIAQFDLTGRGAFALDVTLLDGNGEALISRPIRVNVEQTAAVTAVITRTCLGLSCPGLGDDPSLSACVGGRCVTPECSPETPSACPEASCSTAEACPSPAAACAEAACEEGVCFVRARVGVCTSDRYCDSDQGCITAPGETCVPAAETCDGTDEDCDSSVDESGRHDDWWNAAWSARHLIEVAEIIAGAPLTNFPLPVRLDANTFDYDRARDGGADLRFVDRLSNEVVPHEVEVWDPDGESVVWVAIPELGPGSEFPLHLYYGNPEADDVQDGAATFAGYRMVQHLSESEPGEGDFDDHLDSAMSHHGEASNFDATSWAPSKTGQIGGADAFDGDDAFVEFEASQSLANVFTGGGTISAWIYPRGWGGSDWGRILDKSNNARATIGWSLQLDNGNTTRSIRFEIGFSGGEASWLCPADTIRLDAWHHVAVVYDDGVDTNDAIVYVDGVDCGAERWQDAVGDRKDDEAYAMRAGARTNGVDRTFDGILDELRIYAGRRGPSWIQAEHMAYRGALVAVLDREENRCR